MAAKTPEADWKAMERRYRARKGTPAEIAREFGVSATALRARARKEGWDDPPAAKPPAAASPPNSPADPLSAHRETLARLRATVSRLAARLDALCEAPPDPAEAERAGKVLKELVSAAAKLIPLERQALGLQPDAPLHAVTFHLHLSWDGDRDDARAQLPQPVRH